MLPADVGALVPHTAVRAYVMRDRLHDHATADDIDAMQGILRDSLRAGALGFSTGRTAGHTDLHGEPVPGTFAASTARDPSLTADTYFPFSQTPDGLLIRRPCLSRCRAVPKREYSRWRR